MVNKRGQSLVEFVVIFLALTILGLIVSYTIHPGASGPIAAAQDKAANNIASD